MRARGCGAAGERPRGHATCVDRACEGFGRTGTARAGRAAAADARGPAAGGLRALGRARGGKREGASLPEAYEVLKPGEDAGEAGNDESVDGVRNVDAVLPCQRLHAQRGDPVAEGGGCLFHGDIYN